MKSITTFFIIYIWSFSISKAQIKENNQQWIIKWNATSSIDVFSFPTIQFSIEKMIQDKISVSFENGYQLFEIFKSRFDTTILRPRGFKLNLEFRYYLHNINSNGDRKMEGLYIGLQPFYKHNQYTCAISFQNKFDTINIYEDYFGVLKTSYGLNCTFGIQIPVLSKFDFDFYIGIGCKQRKIKNINREYNSRLDIELYPHTDIIFSESSGYTANFLLGFRIGYRL